MAYGSRKNACCGLRCFGLGTLVLVLSASWTIVSCGRRPSDVLSGDKMADLLTDMYKAEAYASSDPRYATNDSMKKVLRQGVLQDHKTTEQQFTHSLDWYGHNIDLLDEVYEKVEKNLAEEAANPPRLDGNAGSLWSGLTRVALSPHSTEQFTFDLEGSKIPSGNNEVVWEFTAPLLPGRISAFIGTDYTDGTFSYASKTFNNPGHFNLTLSIPDGKKPQRVFGQATYVPIKKETVFVDSIRLFSRPSRSRVQVPMQ